MLLFARVAGAAALPEPSHRYAAEKELPLSLERPRVARHGSHAAQHLAQAHLAVLLRRVERHRHRVVELVRRPLQHLRRLLERVAERNAAADGVLLVDHGDGDASVHRRLHEARDGAAGVQEGLIVQVEEKDVVSLERGRAGSLERLLRIADRDILGAGGRAAPLPRRILELPCNADGALVAAARGW